MSGLIHSPDIRQPVKSPRAKEREGRVHRSYSDFQLAWQLQQTVPSRSLNQAADGYRNHCPAAMINYVR